MISIYLQPVILFHFNSKRGLLYDLCRRRHFRRGSLHKT